MFDASAEYYDLIYGSFKDYPREAAQIAGLLRQNMPHCRTVLDVACGSGEHARLPLSPTGSNVTFNPAGFPGPHTQQRSVLVSSGTWLLRRHCGDT